MAGRGQVSWLPGPIGRAFPRALCRPQWLALSACVGWWVSQQPNLLQVIYGSKGGYLAIALAAFGIAWFVQSQAGKLTSTMAIVLFLVYATVIEALLAGL